MVVVHLAETAAGTYVPQAGGRVEEILALDERGGRAELHIGGGVGAVVAGRRAGDGQAAAAAGLDCLGWPRSRASQPPPTLGETLVGEEDLRRRVAELGEQISRDYAGRSLLLVGVLKGAVFFLSDLMRYIDIPVEVDFMAVASYGSATDSSGVVRILKDLDAAIEGRDVLIVEDIVDSGLTLQYLLRNLGSRNPRSLEVCALLTKPAPAQGRASEPLRRLRDPRPLRRRIRPRPRRAVPQPALRGGPRVLLKGLPRGARRGSCRPKKSGDAVVG